MRRFNDQKAILVGAFALIALFALSARADLSVPISPIRLSQIEQSLREFIDRETAGFGGRVDVTFNTLHANLTAAPCANLEPYVPVGAKLWGRAHIALRCEDTKVRWKVYLPIEVRVLMPVLTAARALSAGQVIEADDFLIRSVDITREPNGVLTDPAQLEARITNRPVLAGTALRADMLKIRPVIASGDTVKIVYVGGGFTIASEGRALASAGNGQSIRVQLDSGKIIVGMVRGGPIVELR